MAANPIIRIAELRLLSNDEPSTSMIRLAGRITSATCPAIERTLCALIPQFRRIVLDLSNVDHIDNSALGILAGLYVQARKVDCDLEIANLKPHLRDRLRSWLESVFGGHEEFLGMTPD
jgi:anti-anti-sigma factor